MFNGEASISCLPVNGEGVRVRTWLLGGGCANCNICRKEANVSLRLIWQGHQLSNSDQVSTLHTSAFCDSNVVAVIAANVHNLLLMSWKVESYGS